MYRDFDFGPFRVGPLIVSAFRGDLWLVGYSPCASLVGPIFHAGEAISFEVD